MEPHCTDPKFLYEDLREKWKHEDDLINQRVTWLLNTQAFLLTAYGVLAKLRMDAIWPKTSTWLERATSPISLAELAVPIVALFILYFLRKALRAATQALGNLNETLRIHQAAGRIWKYASLEVLHHATQDGFKAPIRMMTAFQVTWIALLAFATYSLANR